MAKVAIDCTIMEEKTIIVEIEEINSAAPITDLEITFSTCSSERGHQLLKKLILNKRPGLSTLLSCGNVVYKKKSNKFKDRWIDLEENEELNDLGEYKCMFSRNNVTGMLPCDVK